MKVCIAGSRDTTPEMVLDVINYVDGLVEDFGACEIVHGGAPGTDAAADKAARLYDLRPKVVRPDYTRYPPKVAPLWRNAEMASMVDRVVVFWRGWSRGSLNMIAQAYAVGVPVEVHVYAA